MILRKRLLDLSKRASSLLFNKTRGVPVKEKFRYLFKNIGLLLVSNFASKILVFLLVPLYTSILSTYEYGIYDLFYTTIQLLVPILTLNAVDAVIRFPIDADKKEQDIAFTLGLKCIFLSVFFIIIGTFTATQVSNSEVLHTFWMYFIILFICFVSNNIITHFAKGIGDVLGIAIAGVLGTAAMIFFNVWFLLFAKLSLLGYFWAMILSLAIPTVFLIIRDKLWQYIKIDFKTIKFQKSEKEMLSYCLPLMFINLSWYINNVADRYAITWLCGVNENGIYSVAYKVPAILNALQIVFIQAWQLSAVKEYNKGHGSLFYSSTYQGCQIVMTTLCSLLILSTKLLSNLLFANEFYQAWVYVPFLLIYIVFNTLSGTVGGIFSATKDTKKVALSSIVGAAINIILNFILVFLIGSIGAAIATLISSFVIWILRINALKSYMQLMVNYKLHYLQYLILTVQAVCLIYFKNPIVIYSIQGLCLITILLLDIIDFKIGKRKMEGI